MNKKMLLSILAIALLMFGAGMGTVAYYTETFNSQENTITTAAWDVVADGLLDAEAAIEFEVDAGKLAPGRDGKQDFQLNKEGTEVPVEYRMQVINRSEVRDNLFKAGTPVKLNLVQYINDVRTPLFEDIVLGQEYITMPSTDESFYAIEYVWPWETEDVDDKEFAGKTATLKLSVEARQAKDGAEQVYVYFRDKNYIDPIDPNRPYTNYVYAIEITDEDGKLKEFYGYENHFGNFSYDGTNFKTDKYEANWMYRGIVTIENVQYYQFQRTVANSKELIVQWRVDQ